MITRKYNFTIETNKIGSLIEHDVEIQFSDDATEEEIEKQVEEIYLDWLCDNNQGGYSEIKL